MTEQPPEAQGSAKPDLVMIHGMWSTPAVFAEMGEYFEQQGYRVHIPALPGHRPMVEMDESARISLKQCGINTYAAAIEQLVRSLPRPPVLIGHSMGGLIAQMVAARVPVERLILLSSAAPAGINSWAWSVVRTFGHNLFKFPLWRSLTEVGPANIRYGIANSQTPAVQQDIHQLTTYESGLASFQIGMWFLFRKPLTRLDPEAVGCPVLLLSGQQDRITPITVQRKIARLYKDKATLIELPGLCHWTIAGHGLDTVTGHIKEWLARDG
ncbi:MAG: alpha/beta hydrolase [Halomonadaceae bacterium]|nr:MAG: alpha/beta hydrolase [Halomonadaceae bacterium]